jgi:hypothetical protein
MPEVPQIGPVTAEQVEQAHRQIHRLQGRAEPGISAARYGAAVRCMAHLPEEVRWRGNAVHEAAHGVLAFLLGLRVERLFVTREATLVKGGGSIVAGPGDAQLFGVELLGGGQMQATWLAEHGYPHPELRACIMGIGGLGDLRVVDTLIGAGFILDVRQAETDALRLLAQPQVAAAVHACADLLWELGEISGDRLSRLMDDHHVSSFEPRVWRPGQRLPLAGESLTDCCRSPRS